MKKTGTGINELINRARKKVKNISALKDEKSGQLIHDPKKFNQPSGANILPHVELF